MVLNIKAPNITVSYFHYKKHSYLNDGGAKTETSFYRPLIDFNNGFSNYDNTRFNLLLFSGDFAVVMGLPSFIATLSFCGEDETFKSPSSSSKKDSSKYDKISLCFGSYSKQLKVQLHWAKAKRHRFLIGQ